MTLRKDQEQALDMIREQFGRGCRIIGLGELTGFGVTRTLGQLLKERTADGVKCLALYPAPSPRASDYASHEGLQVGKLGSGAAVEVASYVAGKRRLVDDGNVTGADYGFIVMEEIRPTDRAAAMAIMQAFPKADVLVVGAGSVPPPVCEFDATLTRELGQMSLAALSGAFAGPTLIRR